jgi:hypothetical protein
MYSKARYSMAMEVSEGVTDLRFNKEKKFSDRGLW